MLKQRECEISNYRATRIVNVLRSLQIMLRGHPLSTYAKRT